jgi:uncharacterized protein
MSSAPSSDIAFSNSVKAMQQRVGSAKLYRWMEDRGSWGTRVAPKLAMSLAKRDSTYLTTTNAAAGPADLTWRKWSAGKVSLAAHFS